MEIELTDKRESVMNKTVQKFIPNGFIKGFSFGRTCGNKIKVFGIINYSLVATGKGLSFLD